jgi:hypothetical protein
MPIIKDNKLSKANMVAYDMLSNSLTVHDKEQN